MERHGICVAGSLILDRFHAIESYPDEGFLSTVKGTEFHIGGSGNLILDLAKLDSSLPVKVCALAGEDESGDVLLDVLSRYKSIDVADIKRAGETSVTLVMNAADTKQRTFFFIPGASNVFDITCIPWERIGSRIFHLEYLLLMQRVDAADPEFGTHGARILKAAKDRGMMTSFDMVSEKSERVRDTVRPALAYTDICCINEAEAEAVTGISLGEGGVLSEARAKDALKVLASLGVGHWAVIHSPVESYGYDVKADRFVAVRSLALPTGYIKGTTGAGDAFCSGILYGAHGGTDLEAAMRLAVAAAACSLSESNGTDGMRSYREVMALYERYPLR